MSPTVIAFGTAMDPLTVIFSVLLFGFLGERVKISHLGLLGGLAFSLSMVPLMLSSGQTYTIIAHSMIWAVAAGAYVTTNNLIWPNYFGPKFLGTIRGIVLPVQVAAAGMGAPIYGLMLDSGLDPITLWMISAGAFATAGLLLSQAKPPQHRAPATNRE
jgi:predicted MFS family arabinose efflux permease